MTGEWRDQLSAAVSPLSEGVRTLKVNQFRNGEAPWTRPGRTAAVLVPVLDLPEPSILLTRRAKHLKQHAGQVSFPGGAAESGDDSAVFTALREAEEEIGLSPVAVKPLGFLDRFDSISDYRVLPVVGLVTPPTEWKIDHSEVEEIFTLPLEVALDRSRYSAQTFQSENREIVVHRMDWEGHTVWGLTAAMLINLLTRMGG